MVTLAFERRSTDGPTTTLIGDLLCADEIDAGQVIELVRELERGADRADELTLVLHEFDATLDRAGCPCSGPLGGELTTRALSRLSFAFGRLMALRVNSLRVNS